MTLRAGQATGKTRPGRPPSPLRKGRVVSPAGARLIAPAHKMVKPESASPDEVLKALLEQQVADHGYLQHMAEALQALYIEVETEKAKRATSEAEAAQMDLGMVIFAFLDGRRLIRP